MSTQTITMGSISGGYGTSIILTSTSDAIGAVPLYLKEIESTVFSLSGDQITFGDIGISYLTVYYLNVPDYLDASLNVTVETFPISQTITMGSVSGGFNSRSFLTSSSDAVGTAIPVYVNESNSPVFSISGDQILFGDVGTAPLTVYYSNVSGYYDASLNVTVDTYPIDQTITMVSVSGGFNTSSGLTSSSDAISPAIPVYSNDDTNTIFYISGNQIIFGDIGTGTLTVRYSNVAGYNDAVLYVPVETFIIDQTITMGPISGIYNSTTTLSAYSNASGVTATYSNVDNSPVYTLSGDQITLVEIGTASLTISFPSIYGYNASISTVSVTTTKNYQTITMTDFSGNYNSTNTLISSSDALTNEPQYININNSDIYSISGDQITFERIGTGTLVVSYIETPFFYDASLNITIQTLKIDQTISMNNVIVGNFSSSQNLVSSSDASGATASYSNPDPQSSVYSISGDMIFFTGLGTADLVLNYENYGYNDVSMNISVTTLKSYQTVSMNDVSGDFASIITLISSSDAIGTYSPIYSGGGYVYSLSGDLLTFGEIGIDSLHVLYQVYGYYDGSLNVIVESWTATQNISMGDVSGDFLSSAYLTSYSDASGATAEYANETGSLVYTLSGNQIIFGDIGVAYLTVYYRSVHGYYDASMVISVETRNKTQTISMGTSSISGLYKSSQFLNYISDASGALPEYINESNSPIYSLSGNHITFAEVGTANLVLYFRNIYGYSDMSLNIAVETTSDFVFNVSVSGGVFFLDGIPRPAINFEKNKTYLFIQADVTNNGYSIVFGKLPDNIPNRVPDGVTSEGVPGQTGASTLIKIPSNFKDPLFYYDIAVEGMGPPVAYDISYSLKIVYQPDFATYFKNAFSVSTAGGTYLTQPNISFTSPNKYYFDVSLFPTSSFIPVFGTLADVSSSIYTETVYNNDIKFIFLDLTNYTGDPLKMFERSVPDMGYIEPISTIHSYVVSMSEDQLYIYLDGVESPTIDFQPNETYLFLQHGITNQNYQIMFSQSDGMQPYYYANNSYSYVGTLGQPGAYTQITIPSDFSGALFYFLKSHTREYKYDAKVQQNYLGQSVFALSTGGAFYNQMDISLSAPNRYMFGLDSSSNSSYELNFGTQLDLSNNTVLSSSFITRGRTPGTNKSFVLLDLTTYLGSQLYYLDRNTVNMGYYETTADVEYSVTISGSSHDFYIDGERYLPINFKTNGTSKFKQSDVTNVSNQMYFSSDPYVLIPVYDISFHSVGTPGVFNAYTSVTVPSNFAGNLYFVNQSSTISPTYTYFVKRIFNAYNLAAFAFSTTIAGPYYNQVDLSFNSPNRYLFEYYWDMNNPTANTHSYNLVFGTQVDVSSAIYGGAVNLDSTPGTYRSAIYLDLSGYAGNPLYAYNATHSNMGYSTPPSSPDFTFVVTVAEEVFFLNGEARKSIDFDASKTYLFIQSDTTNIGYPMIFGKLPNDAANIVQNGIKIVGTLGQSNAYTLVTTPPDFMDSLFYFHLSLPNKGPAISYTVDYTVKVVQTRSGLSVYSVSTSGESFFNQPSISFTSPNKYYFDVSEMSNIGYQLVFGTQIDMSGSIYEGTMYDQITDGNIGSFVFLDLTDYIGLPLYLFERNNSGMGWVPAPVIYDFSYNVSISGNFFALNGTDRLFIDFDANKTYLFDQSNSTNISGGGEIAFGRLPDDTANLITSGVTFMGTPGRPGAYTYLSLPSTYLDSLFYFHPTTAAKGPTTPYDVVYYVKTQVVNALTKQYVISQSSGGPYQSINFDTSFSLPIKYYFNVADPTNTGFKIVFGTERDISSSIYGGTVYNQNSEFVYLDLNDYTGAPLYLFESVSKGMGYTAPAVTANTWTVGLDTRQVGITLSGNFYPVISFVPGETYVFTQDSSTNLNSQIVFGTTIFGSSFYTTGVTYSGTPGINGSYTQFIVPPDFSGNLYYYTTKSTTYIRYYVQVQNDVCGNPQFSFSQTGSDFVLRPNISFTSPNQYLFSVAHASNVGNILSFGTEIGTPETAYVTRSGTLGTANSMIILDLSGSGVDSQNPYQYFGSANSMGFHYTVSGSIDSFDLLTVATSVYYVKVVQNSIGVNVYAFATTESGTYLNQSIINLVAPNKFLFNCAHSSNVGYKIVFGTDLTAFTDSTKQYTDTTYRIRNAGDTNANIYLDLTNYTGKQLYYFDSSYANMGYIETRAMPKINQYIVSSSNSAADSYGYVTASSDKVAISTDLNNWTVYDQSQNLLYVIKTIAANDSIILIGGRGITCSVAWSVDGKIWNPVTSIPNTTVVNMGVSSIIWNGGAWVLTGMTNSWATQFVYTSLDGKTWTVQNMSAVGTFYGTLMTSNNSNSIAYPNGKIFIPENRAENTFILGTYSLTTPTAITWSRRSITPFTGTYNNTTQVNFMGNCFYSSGNGTRVNLKIDQDTLLNDIAWIPNEIITAGSNDNEMVFFAQMSSVPVSPKYFFEFGADSVKTTGEFWSLKNSITSTFFTFWSAYPTDAHQLVTDGSMRIASGSPSTVAYLDANNSIVLYTSFSISFWINIKSINGSIMVVDLSSYNKPTFTGIQITFLQVTINSLLSVIVSGNPATSNLLSLNAWHHLVFSFSRSGNNFRCNAYANGNNILSNTNIPVDSRILGSDIVTDYTIGRASQGTLNSSLYYIDNYRHFDYALTAADAAYYSISGNDGTRSTFAFVETAASGATLIMNLDSRNVNSLARTGTVTTWYDLTANQNNATIYGSVAYGSLGGQNCALFPGDNGSYGQARNGVYFTGSSFTIQSWVYVRQTANWSRIIDFGNGSGSNNVLVGASYSSSGTPGVYIEGQQFQSSHPGVGDQKWHHICCTFNYVSGSTGTATIYVDGVASGAATLPKPVSVVRNLCYIGRSNWGFGDPNLNGGIGSLQIYNGLLTGDEISRNYNATKGSYGL
jgi:hypothetical protein